MDYEQNLSSLHGSCALALQAACTSTCGIHRCLNKGLWGNTSIRMEDLFGALTKCAKLLFPHIAHRETPTKAQTRDACAPTQRAGPTFRAARYLVLSASLVLSACWNPPGFLGVVSWAALLGLLDVLSCCVNLGVMLRM